MKEIGGYFSLELSSVGNMPHFEGVLLNTGRNALEYILRTMLPNVSKLYLPYFTCDTVLEALKKTKIPYEFYSINSNLELSNLPLWKESEYLLYTNYYGIKDAYVHKLDEIYPDQLIVDNAQALYCPSTKKSLYSPRKYVGIPDGGIAFTDKPLLDITEIDYSHDRISHLLKRIDLGATEGYADFRTNSALLKNQPIKRMSNLTQSLIGSVNFEDIKDRRRRNFSILHAALGKSNNLIIPDMESFACPLVYPYFAEEETLKNKLIEKKIFVATYWPNVLEWCKEDTLEYQLANRIIAIPIDQRYGEKEMNYIINNIL